LNTSAAENVFKRADQLYAGRNDLANVRVSVELLRTLEPSSRAAWRLARAYFFLGQEASQAESSGTFHEAGVKAGALSARLQPDWVAGHFWLGVNLALLAQRAGSLQAAIHALKAKRELRRAIEIDDTYHAAGPRRVLGRLEQKMPRLLGGGLARAAANFERAISIAPNNTVTRIYFAEFLFEMGAVARARAELEVVLGVPLDPDWAFEIKRDRVLAREWLRKLNALPG